MEQKGLRIWKIAVVVLVLCNIGLMLTIWLKPSMSEQRGPGHETPRDYVIRNLKMTEAQVKQYDVLIQDHQASMHQLRDQAQGYRQQLFTGLGKGMSNATTDSLAALIANTQKQIEIVTYKHFEQVRALCTDAQKPEFDNIIGDVIKKMNGRPRPPKDHEHGGPPPPPDGGPDGDGPHDGPPGPPPPPPNQ